ncbi:MAG: hypothetical protein RLZ44_1701, partial [Pseudomonadota bacterium]
IRVGAQVHTIGGLSAHGDQQALCDWYGRFEHRPPVALVHGEAEAREVLAERLRVEFTARVWTPQPGDRLDLVRGAPIG